MYKDKEKLTSEQLYNLIRHPSFPGTQSIRRDSLLNSTARKILPANKVNEFNRQDIKKMLRAAIKNGNFNDKVINQAKGIKKEVKKNQKNKKIKKIKKIKTQ